MKHLEKFENKEFDWEDFDEEEFSDENIYKGRIWNDRLGQYDYFNYVISQLEISSGCYIIFNKDSGPRTYYKVYRYYKDEYDDEVVSISIT